MCSEGAEASPDRSFLRAGVFKSISLGSSFRRDDERGSRRIQVTCQVLQTRVARDRDDRVARAQGLGNLNGPPRRSNHSRCLRKGLLLLLSASPCLGPRFRLPHAPRRTVSRRATEAQNRCLRPRRGGFRLVRSKERLNRPARARRFSCLSELASKSPRRPSSNPPCRPRHKCVDGGVDLLEEFTADVRVAEKRVFVVELVCKVPVLCNG